MGKEILTEQRISDDCKKAIRRFFWDSLLLIAVAALITLMPVVIFYLAPPSSEKSDPPFMYICLILYACLWLVLIICFVYEVVRNVIAVVHLMRKGFSVAEDEVISVNYEYKWRGKKKSYYTVSFLKHGRYRPNRDADMPDQRYFTTDELYYRIGIGERFYVVLAGKRIVKVYSKKYYVLEGEPEEQKE